MGGPLQRQFIYQIRVEKTDGSGVKRCLIEQKSWKKVIFSDEVRFRLSSDGRVTVWRQNGKRFQPEFTKRKSTDRRSLMFWGIIRSDGKKLLLKCPDSFKSADYVSFMEFAKSEFFQPDYVFQNDNSPVHRGQIVRDWVEENGIQTLEWPPYSPDLNIIENLWGFMKKSLSSQVILWNDLESKIWELWNTIPSDFIENLYNSLPERISKCYRSKGHIINY